MLDREPLLRFSHYLTGRVCCLLDVADEIERNLDQAFADRECMQGGPLMRAETLMWLWLLGAYEVVRTMCQARGCFSQRLQSDLIRLKKELGAVRMPAAKMEKAGKKGPVTSNRSPAGLAPATRDLLVNDPDSRPDVYARALIASFDAVFFAIKKEDVLGDHEGSYFVATHPLQRSLARRR
jgi:hypothetical protein